MKNTKKLISMYLSLLMVITSLFALPFSASAASYPVNATRVENVSSWAELNAALTNGKANKTIVLTKDISADPEGDMNGYYEWGTEDPSWGWQPEDDHDCVITPNINGNVVIDLNGHDIQLGNPTYPGRYEVAKPRMFNLSSATGLYIINSKSSKGNITISAKNTACLVYSNNVNASFHVVANSSHPVTLTARDAQTGNSKGGASIVSVDPDSNSSSKCNQIEFIGANIVVDSYGGSVLDFSASTAMYTPVYIGGASFEFIRQYSHLVYTYDISYTYVTMFNASLKFGSENNSLFVSRQTDSDKLAVSNILSDDYYSTSHSYYTLTGISDKDDLFSKTIGKATVTSAINGGAAASVKTYMTSANVHYSVSTVYELKTVSEHSFNELSRKAPTCTEDGNIVKQCDECAATFTEIVSALGHNMTAVAAKAETCTEAGNNAYYYCGRCKNYFKDEAGTIATLLDAETIAAKGHDFSNNAKECKNNCGTANPDYKDPSAPVTTKKKNNPLSVKAKSPALKYAKLKKKAQTIALKKWAAVKNAKGTVTYKKTKGNKKITINKKTGKITVMKGLKKGTYKVKIKVSAAGNAEYNAAVKTVTVKIKVK